MKYPLIFLTLLFYCTGYAQNTFPINDYNPYRIVLSWKSDPATTQSINWQTYTDSSAWVEYTVDDGSPYLAEIATRVEVSTKKVISDNNYYFINEATLHNLIPGSVYAYRVGNGMISSEWFQFKTLPENPDSFSFLYFGDVQNYITPLAKRTIISAVKKEPYAAFMTFAGDLVGNGTREAAWDEFFGFGSWIFPTIPVMPAIGNHEYAYDTIAKNVVYVPNYQNSFCLPENGPEGFKELFYYFDIGSMRIISIDNTALTYNIYPDKVPVLLSWIEQAIAGNKNRWCIIVCHQPVFPSVPGNGNEILQKKLLPIIEKYHVDLVLQGHHHNYARGYNKNTGKLPVYVVSVCGGKMYPLNFDDWKDRTSANHQFYHVIRVNKNSLEFESYMANNQLFDAFEIKCDGNGKKQFIDLTPDMEGDYSLPHINVEKFFKTDSLKNAYEIQKEEFIDRVNKN